MPYTWSVWGMPALGITSHQLTARECQKRNLTLLETHPFGIMSCDPPERLLRSAFAASARIGAPNASFVLYTGDFVRHAIRDSVALRRPREMVLKGPNMTKAKELRTCQN